MTWLKIDNPEIDGAKLQAEIEAEVARLKAEKKLPEDEPTGKSALSAFATPREGEALLEIMESYSSGWDLGSLSRRRPLLRPLLPLILKLLRRFLKPQYIFNSLVLELLRNQEERIKALEDGHIHHREHRAHGGS